VNLKFLREQPFITTTGVAALIHSTWSLGTLFSGEQPLVTTLITSDPGQWLAQSVAVGFWLAPAALIAFSLDVGQIVTSHEIRTGKRSWKRYATFAIFSIATYYLQWLYIAHHMPILSLSGGISQQALPFAQGVLDMAVWIIPALLPLSTLLYTFAQDTQSDLPGRAAHPVRITRVSREGTIVPVDPVTGQIIRFICPHCNREFKAKGALGMHEPRCEMNPARLTKGS